MSEYRVVWEIDIVADSPEEAAQIAKQYQVSGHWCSVFDVFDEAGNMIQVDLDEEA